MVLAGMGGTEQSIKLKVMLIYNITWIKNKMNIIKDLTVYFHLPIITYNKEKINVKSIVTFMAISHKNNNDKTNKTRENIIGALINQKIPDDYFVVQKWKNLKKSLDVYLQKLFENTPYENIKCLQKGGRKHNFDFEITANYSTEKNTKTFNVEFKFNTSSVQTAPQFVSPMRPSQYMSHSYEEYYYDRFLTQLANFSGFSMPDKKEYMSQIHSPTPKCMKKYQDLYYEGCAKSSKYSGNTRAVCFYELSKRVSAESIRQFIELTELNIELLTTYLQSTQENKIYMLYYDNSFIIQKIHHNDHILTNYIKNVDKYRFECLTAGGNTIQLLLRWKNGNGIAFPSFQLSVSSST
jgi:hypothetical protein